MQQHRQNWKLDLAAVVNIRFEIWHSKDYPHDDWLYTCHYLINLLIYHRCHQNVASWKTVALEPLGECVPKILSIKRLKSWTFQELYCHMRLKGRHTGKLQLCEKNFKGKLFQYAHGPSHIKVMVGHPTKISQHAPTMSYLDPLPPKSANWHSRVTALKSHSWLLEDIRRVSIGSNAATERVPDAHGWCKFEWSTSKVLCGGMQEQRTLTKHIEADSRTGQSPTCCQHYAIQEPAELKYYSKSKCT